MPILEFCDISDSHHYHEMPIYTTCGYGVQFERSQTLEQSAGKPGRWGYGKGRVVRGNFGVGGPTGNDRISLLTGSVMLDCDVIVLIDYKRGYGGKAPTNKVDLWGKAPQFGK